MNGDTARLEPANRGSPTDLEQRWREALRCFNAAAKAAADVGEHQLQRLAEDAAARAIGWIEDYATQVRRQLALQLSGLDGKDSEAPRQEEG